MTIDNAASKPNWFSRLAHPGSFMAWSRPAIVPLAVVTALLFVAGLYIAFFRAPLETENVGTTLPLLYIHVPNAWLSQFVYGLMFVAAFGTLVWRHPLADVAAKAAAPLGATFTTLALFTGSLWGRPTWGTFWEWDGRMTSTLILLFIYLGIIALLPLLLMLLGFTLLFLTLHLVSMRTEILRRRVDSLSRQAAARGA